MPGQQKLGVEEKVKIILEYLSGKIGMCEAARSGGVNKTTMGQWVRNYKVYGIDAFLPYKNRVYSTKQKEQAVKDYLSGELSVSEICKKYRIRHR